jgi:hypothetical protein
LHNEIEKKPHISKDEELHYYLKLKDVRDLFREKHGNDPLVIETQYRKAINDGNTVPAIETSPKGFEMISSGLKHEGQLRQASINNPDLGKEWKTSAGARPAFPLCCKLQ